MGLLLKHDAGVTAFDLWAGVGVMTVCGGLASEADPRQFAQLLAWLDAVQPPCWVADFRRFDNKRIDPQEFVANIQPFIAASPHLAGPSSILVNDDQMAWAQEVAEQCCRLGLARAATTDPLRAGEWAVAAKLRQLMMRSHRPVAKGVDAPLRGRPATAQFGRAMLHDHGGMT